MTSNVTEDLEMVRRCRTDDPEAFAGLVLKYQNRVFNVICRFLSDYEEARDVTQSAFIRAFESLDGFKGTSAFYTWLYRIAVNAALDARKKQARRPETSVETLEELTTSGRPGVGNPDVGSPVAQLVRTEEHRRITDAIDNLDDSHRLVVVLRDIEELDYAEIAEITGLPTGTVKSRLHRARLILRDKLKDMVS